MLMMRAKSHAIHFHPSSICIALVLQLKMLLLYHCHHVDLACASAKAIESTQTDTPISIIKAVRAL